MKCKYCGSELVPGTVYCNKCGNKIDNSSFTTAEKNNAGAAEEMKEESINRKRFSAVKTILGLIVITIMFSICYSMFIDNNESDSDSEVETSVPIEIANEHSSAEEKMSQLLCDM